MVVAPIHLEAIYHILGFLLLANVVVGSYLAIEKINTFRKKRKGGKGNG
ncbi:hypothetical protein SAMN04488134_11351 [Amphibacillus marinus]|uniref:Uncharacterized protein n=1 Tax=Amphibacillus marinus TaxID=872970 RepID=A0A1H8SNK7_9BACI|nr:hypothetical protein [Amphibacillus marinus]SEO80211.1 hypothetical protein SAMN04488134_11351 [Amphibacillus marinus]